MIGISQAFCGCCFDHGFRFQRRASCIDASNVSQKPPAPSSTSSTTASGDVIDGHPRDGTDVFNILVPGGVDRLIRPDMGSVEPRRKEIPPMMNNVGKITCGTQKH